jgi:hypothetical protein
MTTSSYSSIRTTTMLTATTTAKMTATRMYRSGLVPPRFALFGLVGGPLVSIVGVLVILGVLPAEGLHQVLVAPEFIWELGIGIYLIVKGYRTSSPALAGTQEAQSAPVE